jgi:hypothetical protein
MFLIDEIDEYEKNIISSVCDGLDEPELVYWNVFAKFMKRIAGGPRKAGSTQDIPRGFIRALLDIARLAGKPSLKRLKRQLDTWARYVNTVDRKHDGID